MLCSAKVRFSNWKTIKSGYFFVVDNQYQFRLADNIVRVSPFSNSSSEGTPQF